MDLLKRRLIMLPKDEPYIVFADPVAEEFCATSFGDGVGLTKRKARKVATAQFVAALAGFQDRASITSFDEFRYFNHVGEAGNWSGCSLLTSITLPKSCTYLDWSAFRNCSSLESINLENVMKMRGMAFQGCTNLRIAVNMPNLMDVAAGYTIDYQSFMQSGITKVTNLGTISALGTYSCFQGCASLTEVWLSRTIKNIARLSMYNCPALTTVVVLSTTPPVVVEQNSSLHTIGGAPGRKIYVPYSADHSILNAYKSSEYWTIYSADIYELNPDGTVPDE